MLKKPSIFRSRYTTGYGILVLVSGMLLLAFICLSLIMQFYKAERQRALLEWQVVLSLVAESREKDVDQWLQGKIQTLSSLADNTSLQLYMTDLATSHAATNGEAQAPAATDYLRILLQVTAERAGFAPSTKPEKLGNDLVLDTTAGIALLDGQRNTIAATRYMPEVSGPLADFVKNAKPGERSSLDIFTLEEKSPASSEKPRMVAFLEPIFAVQGDRKPEDHIGFVLGVVEINDSLLSRLYQPGLPYNNSETLLVRKTGNFIEYISPLPGQPGSQGLQLNANTDNLDSAFLVAAGGGFVKKMDYRKKEVLAAARKIESMPWYLIHKIDADVALKPSTERARNMAALLILITLLVLIVLFAIWRHASSLRAETAAKEYKEIASRHGAQEKLLRLIADNQPDAVSIIDSGGNYRFANLVAATNAKMYPAEMLGKSMQAVLGASLARKYLENSGMALEKKSVVSYLRREKHEKSTQIFQVQHIPLKEIPDPYSSEVRVGTLVVENDITAAIMDRVKHEKTLRSLVETLTALIDAQVPFFAHHSARVSKLARIIAREMGLGRDIREATEFAGKLINLGKIFIPEELLSKDGELSPKELEKMREAASMSADLIKNIPFAGPVSETIRQSQERMDGSGLLGLKAEEIILPARILMVANAFIGMVSDRPHRPRLDMDSAIGILIAESGGKYDRAVVLVLANYLENHSDDNSWLF